MGHTENPTATLESRLRVAMRAAYAFGITYWQQANNDGTAQNEKADKTADAFESHLDESCHCLARHAELASAMPPALEVASDSIKQLFKFYQVATLEELVEAQSSHIERLQGKLPSDDQPAFRPVRAG
jgi:hypothetical protein